MPLPPRNERQQIGHGSAQLAWRPSVHGLCASGVDDAVVRERRTSVRWRSAFLPYIPPRPSTVAEGRTDSESHPAMVAADAQRSQHAAQLCL
jgi:hypothetical protein